MRNGKNKSNGKGPVSHRQFEAMSERCLTQEVKITTLTTDNERLSGVIESILAVYNGLDGTEHDCFYHVEEVLNKAGYET